MIKYKQVNKDNIENINYRETHICVYDIAVGRLQWRAKCSHGVWQSFLYRIWDLYVWCLIDRLVSKKRPNTPY